MSLAHAILVCLVDESMTGYELAKRFDSSVGFFWRANHQQIYRELTLLSEKAYVKGKLVNQIGKPNKTVFSVTKAGKDELWKWSQESTPPASIKEELMLKFYALSAVDTKALAEQLVQRMAGHRERLELYQQILNKSYKDASSLDLAATGRLLGLKAGLSLERNWIVWCTEALEELKRFEGRNR